MDPVTLAAAGVSAGAAGLSYFGQSQANATNVRLAREQMKFQERMSNTSMQRHRSDLEAAGYNPMLGVGGPGASTPVGASARVENAPGAGVTSGLGAKQMMAQLQLVKAQTGREQAAAMLAQQQRFDLIGKTEQGAGRAAVLRADTLEALLPLVRKHMGAQIERELASAVQARSHAAEMDAQSILLRFEMQHAKNLSEAEKSFYFRVVAPYVHSAGEVVGIGSRLAMPLAIGRGARAIQRR